MQLSLSLSLSNIAFAAYTCSRSNIRAEVMLLKMRLRPKPKILRQKNGRLPAIATFKNHKIFAVSTCTHGRDFLYSAPTVHKRRCKTYAKKSRSCPPLPPRNRHSSVALFSQASSPVFPFPLLLFYPKPIIQSLRSE